MSRWTAPSDRDYDDDVAHRRPWTIDLHCQGCGRPVEVDADHPGPVWCATCAAKDVRPVREGVA